MPARRAATAPPRRPRTPAFQHVRRVSRRRARPASGRPQPGGQQVVGRAHRLVANVHQHEAAGAVGVLSHAGREAGLAEGSGLLLRQPRRRWGWEPPSHSGRALPITALLGAMPGSTLRGMFSSARMSSFSPACAGRTTWCARRCWGRCCAPRRQSAAPHQPGVDGAEGQFAALGHLARAGHVVEQPGQLGAESTRPASGRCGTAGNRRARRRAASHTAARCGSPARRWRAPAAASGAFPDQRGFALVGDADGGYVGRGGRGVAQRFARHVEAGCAELAGIVLDPARPGIVLVEFTLADAAPPRRRGRTRWPGTGRAWSGRGQTHSSSLCFAPFRCAPARGSRRLKGKPGRAHQADDDETRDHVAYGQRLGAAQGHADVQRDGGHPRPG